MGWWQDFKDNYKYQKDLKVHQQQCKTMQADLDAFKATQAADKTISGCQRDLNALAYQDAHVQEYTPAPTPPAKPNFWGKLFGRVRAGSTELPPKEQNAYENTKLAFGGDNRAVRHRADERERVGMQQDINAGLADRIGQLNRGEAARQTAYDAAVAGKKPGIASLNRLGPTLMKVAPETATQAEKDTIQAQNKATVDLMKEYSDLVTASGKPETAATIDQAHYAEVTQKMTDILKPVIREGIDLANQLDMEQVAFGRNDSVQWATPEVLDTIQRQEKCYMTISDLSKVAGRGAAGAMAVGTLDQATAYHDSVLHLNQYSAGLRQKAFKDMEGATKEQLSTLVYSNAERLALERGPEALGEKLTENLGVAQNAIDMHKGPSDRQKRDFATNMASVPGAKPSQMDQAAPAPQAKAPEREKAPEPAKSEPVKMDFNTFAQQTGRAPAPTEHTHSAPASTPKVKTNSGPSMG